MKDEAINLNNVKSIAIMGGTFNPVHYGHLVAAEAVRSELNVEKVIFIPSGRPPHKTNKEIADKEHRYMMTYLAVKDNPFFEVSRCEIDREGYTYSVDTIAMLKKRCPKDMKIYFIIGADAVNEIFTWKNPEKLVTMCDFVAVTRPGFDKASVCKQVLYIKESYHSSIRFLNIPAVDISSSDIRRLLNQGKSIKYLLPESVESYIYDFELYRQQYFQCLEKKVKNILSEKRFQHTAGVIETAKEMALIYGQDSHKAALASLLHDYAKEMPLKEKLAYCEKYAIETDEIMLAQPDLLHSFIGASIAEAELDINDIDILNAIAYHTTGRAGMSILEKIIFLADIIEPNRKTFPMLKKIKKLAKISLDEAMVCALESTMAFVKENNQKIHPLGLAALKDIKDKINQ